MYEFFCVLVFSTLILGLIAWAATAKSRLLEPQDRLLSQLIPNQCRGLEPYFSDSDGYSLLVDETFYLISGGREGMKWRCKNAGLFVKICQQSLPGVTEEDMAFMLQRAMTIKFMCLVGMLERPTCWLFPALPRISAHVVAQLYWDTEATFMNLCRRHNPAMIPQLHMML